MMSDEQKPSPAPVKSTKSWRAITKWLGAGVLSLLGIILLIATKSTAGSALLVAAALVCLPTQGFGKLQHIAHWVRAGLVCVLVALAISSVAGTDVVPEQAKTGVKFIDQVLAIWQRFQDNLFGRKPTPRK